MSLLFNQTYNSQKSRFAETYKKALSDTFVFLLGALIGLSVDMMIQKLKMSVPQVMENIFFIGIIQLLINAIILQITPFKFGFFTMGLFTTQALVIKDIIKN